MTCHTGQVDDTSSGGPHQGQETLGDPDGAQPVDVHHGLVLGQRAPLRLCERRHARVVHHRPALFNTGTDQALLCSTQAQTKVSGLSPPPTALFNTGTDQGQWAFTTAHSFHHRPQLCSTQAQTKVSWLSLPPIALFNTGTDQGQWGLSHRPPTSSVGLSTQFNTGTDQGQCQLAFTTAHQALLNTGTVRPSSAQHRHRPRSVGFHHRPQICSTQAQTNVSGLSPPPTALFNTGTDQGNWAFTTAHSSVQHRHRPRSVGFHHRPQLCSAQTKVSELSPPPTALLNTGTDQGQWAFSFQQNQ